MSKALPIGTVIVCITVIIIVSGSGTARDAFAAIVITIAVCIVLAVAGLLAMIVASVRREHLTYRPDPAITRTRVRAEIVASYPHAARSGPERPGAARTPLALPAARRDAS